MSTLEALVIQARAKDSTKAQRDDAFSELVIRFQDLAFGCAYAVLGDTHLAQDVTQEAFIAAYHNLAQLREPRAFPGWLRRIILTRCARLTRGKHLAATSLDVVDERHAQGDPALLWEQRELYEEVEPEWLARQFATNDRRPLRFYLEAGLLVKPNLAFFPGNLTANRHFRDVLQAKGYPLIYSEYNGAHEDFSLRGSVADGLVALAHGMPGSGMP